MASFTPRLFKQKLVDAVDSFSDNYKNESWFVEVNIGQNEEILVTTNSKVELPKKWEGFKVKAVVEN
jgi:hypothetical protein